MFKTIAITPVVLSMIVIVSILTCKYYNNSGILFLIIILTSIYYQIDANKKNNKNRNFEEKVVNLSTFIIITGILGYIVVRIVSLFFSGFN